MFSWDKPLSSANFTDSEAKIGTIYQTWYLCHSWNQMAFIINQSAQGRGVAGRAWDCKGRGMETDNNEGNWDSGESDTAVSGKEKKDIRLSM